LKDPHTVTVHRTQHTSFDLDNVFTLNIADDIETLSICISLQRS